MKKSFSLIELIIFVSILSLFFVSAASIITIMLQHNTLRIDKMKALHYTDQLKKWLQQEKEIDWLTFVIRTSNNIYCFENEEPSWGATVTTGSDCPLLNAFYRRYVTFTTTGSGANAQVQAVINIDWIELGNSYSTSIYTLFSQWQE